MKQKKYRWAVKTESTGSVKWMSVAMCETRKAARWTKNSQNDTWRMCTGVRATIHKAIVGPEGTILIGKKQFY